MAMAEGLPEGLITNSDTIAGEIDRLHDVDVEDVIKMWKVYSATKAILPDDTGRRLANFLWRVWGSQNILHNLTGNQLAAHFNAISEDGPLRTTPTQSPRTSRHLTSATRTPETRDQPVPPRSGGRSEKEQFASLTKAGSFAANSAKPTSILKKPRGGPSSEITEAAQMSPSPATALVPSIVTEGDDGEESTPRSSGSTLTADPKIRVGRLAKDSPLARLPNNRTDSETLPLSSVGSSSTLQSASSEDTIKPQSEAAPKAKRTKTVFHASARKRPVAMKRKSTQSSSSNTSSIMSPRPSTAATSLLVTSSPSPAVAAELAIGQHEPVFPSTKQAPNPEPSGETNTFPPKTPAPKPATQSRQSSLVEPDFRSKFVEKTRSAQSSFVNLPSLLRKPNSTTATSSSHTTGTMDMGQQTQPTGRGRGKVTFTEGSKPPGPSGPDSSDDGESPALPRTKSQLTLLLEKDRRAGGSGQGRQGS